MKFLKIAAGVIAGILIIGGVGIYWMASSMEPTIAIGTASPNVTLATLEGQPLALSSLRGKVVLLDFWGST